MRYLPLLALALAFAGACGSSTKSSTTTSSSGGGGSAAGGDCFDYASFDGTSPTVSFQSDVVPIFAQSCALSTSCHSCDNSDNPGCTQGGYTPFLGVSTSGPKATAAQIAAIITATVGVASSLQQSTADGTMVGNPSMSIVKAGDPSSSFLAYKLDGEFPTTGATDNDVTCSTLTCASTKNCGEAMPLGGPALAETDRDTIRRWIAQGAKNN